MQNPLKPVWNETGTDKPVAHTLWPLFEAWVAEVKLKGENPADHPIWWECFSAGAAAALKQLELDLEAKQRTEQAVPPRASTTDLLMLQSKDFELLQAAVDGKPELRDAAMAELTYRISRGGCCPKVALLKGALGRLNPDATQVSRQAAILKCRDRYNLDIRVWF